MNTGTGGAAIGAYVGSIFPVVGTMLGAAIGGLVGGVVDSVFGSSAWNTTDTGINLGFGDEGFLPEQYERQKKRGGLFSSTKRRYRFSDLPDETAGMLEDTYSSTLAAVGQMYDAIGVAVDQAALEAVRTGSLMINAKATQEEMEEQIGTWFFELSEALVGSVDSSLDTATLERLAGSLTAANSVFRAMNLRLFETSKAGAEMASSLIDVAGGLENFAAATDYYYQNFYSETERANALVEQYTSVVGSFNEQFGAAISKRSDLRDFVEALDLTTTAGQNAYAAAMNLAPALVGLDEAMQIATQGVHDIAGDIAGMFASTYERIMLDGMKSDQERYDYFKSQADAISDAMDHIADPAVIKSMMQDYDRILNEAYRSLSAESQDIMREDILKTLRLVEDKSLDLINSAPGNSQQQQVVETLAQSVTDLSAQQKQNAADQKQTNAQLQASLQDIANQLSGVVAQFGGYVQAMPGSFNVQITIPEVG